MKAVALSLLLLGGALAAPPMDMNKMDEPAASVDMEPSSSLPRGRSTRSAKSSTTSAVGSVASSEEAVVVVSAAFSAAVPTAAV